MNDRFRFRVWDKENKCLHYPTRYNNFSIVNGTVVKIESYPTANSAYLGKRIAYEFDDAVIMQCTGLKDKNSKLIYEGDILKGKKDMICSPHSSKMVDKVGVVEIPQNMFVASCRDVKNNCTQFCQNDWVKTEVIGNIYENKELLESEG